jgi:tRNA(adenine34) deaminase
MLSRSQYADQAALDTAMMRRCIEHSAVAAKSGELPFAALVCQGERIVVAATNRVTHDADVTRHAELLAVSEAQKVLGRRDLSDCALYSNVEPCAMCSFPIRETRIRRVIYSINSPMMGGHSKWNVLGDSELASIMPEAFGPVPEIVVGLCRREAEAVWWLWNPFAWAVIRHRGCFGRAVSANGEPVQSVARRTGQVMRKLFSPHSHAM